MPIHDYDCAGCGHTFEELVLGSESVECPECGAGDVAKRISTFSVGLPSHMRSEVGLPGPSGGGFGAGACGTCGDPGGPGSCSTN